MIMNFINNSRKVLDILMIPLYGILKKKKKKEMFHSSTKDANMGIIEDM
jgi:hypothetical protein